MDEKEWIDYLARLMSNTEEGHRQLFLLAVAHRYGMGLRARNMSTLQECYSKIFSQEACLEVRD